MEDLKLFFKKIYQNFNDRKIDLVIDNMTADVQWANGMDGGYVYGRDCVREHWTKQFEVVSSNVTPSDIKDENDVVKIKVHQVVHDLNGNLLADDMVEHIFTIHNEKIAGFDIGDKHEGQ